MTDKDIKDYCKNCDVEPPAMKFKCPECKHNPDNKNNFVEDINVPHKEQIIIDGVDVSKYICCLRICTTTKKPEAICNEYAYCSQTPNCYFKQLALKTQECEELKLKCLGNRNDYLCEKQVTKRYRKALEEIEEICRQLLDDDYIRSIAESLIDIISKVKKGE